MEVILTQDIENLGMTGQVVDVARGYARNKLIPSRMAMEATPGNLKAMHRQREEYETRAEREREKAQGLSAELEGLVLTIPRKAGEKDKLYGSVTNMDIAAALAEQDIHVDRRRIRLSQPIKTLGEHDVTIRLHQDVIAPIKISVIPEEEE